MRPKGPVLLNRDDPVWAELVAEITGVISRSFVEDPHALFGPHYMPSDEEPGFAFAALNRDDRMELLAAMVSWHRYEDQGIGLGQRRIVMSNVLDGKSPEKWMEGAFFDGAMPVTDRVENFRAMVEDSRNSHSGCRFEETDGNYVPWEELSDTAKLQYIARDAAIADVPFHPFAEAVKNVIGDAGEAALRALLENQKELRAIAKLLPDDGRTEPTPLDEQVADVLKHVAALEQENERLRSRETSREGMRGTARGGQLSLDDLRREARGQQPRDDGERSKRKEKER